MFIAGISFFSGLMLIVFSIVLYWKKAPLQKVSCFLAITFLLLACWDFSVAYLYSGLSARSDFLLSFYYPIDLVLSLCIAPTLYFYVRMLLGNNQFQWKKQLGYHALPIIPALCFLFYFAAIPPGQRVAMLLSESFAEHWMVVGITVLYYIQSVCYFSYCLLKVRKLRTSDYLLVIDQQQINIRWLMYLSALSLGTTFIYSLVWTFSSSMQVSILAQQCIFSSLIVYLFMQSLLSTGLSMQSIITVPTVKQSELNILPVIRSPFVRKLNISEEEAHNILLKLSEVLESEELYLSKKCDLQQLTHYSKIPRHHISFVINTYSEYNFTDFINKYRVDHVCRLLKSGQEQKLKLEAIGYKCGFGSKANFFKTFKRFTGKTPAEYLIVQQSISSSVNAKEDKE